MPVHLPLLSGIIWHNQYMSLQGKTSGGISGFKGEHSRTTCWFRIPQSFPEVSTEVSETDARWRYAQVQQQSVNLAWFAVIRLEVCFLTKLYILGPTLKFRHPGQIACGINALLHILHITVYLLDFTYWGKITYKIWPIFYVLLFSNDWISANKLKWCTNYTNLNWIMYMVN